MTADAGFTAGYYARQDRFAQTAKYHAELDRLAQLMDLRDGMRVLDIGCSTGRAAAYFEARAACTVIRLDAPAAWLDDPPAHRAVRGDGHALPFPAKTFDAVYLAHSLGHVRDPGRLLAEAARVARPAARLAVVTPNRGFVRALRPLNWLCIIRYTPDPTVRTMFSLARLRALAEAAGWRVAETECAGALPDYLRRMNGSGWGGSLRERVYMGARRTAAT